MCLIGDTGQLERKVYLDTRIVGFSISESSGWLYAGSLADAGVYRFRLFETRKREMRRGVDVLAILVICFALAVAARSWLMGENGGTLATLGFETMSPGVS